MKKVLNWIEETYYRVRWFVKKKFICCNCDCGYTKVFKDGSRVELAGVSHAKDECWACDSRGERLTRVFES